MTRAGPQSPGSRRAPGQTPSTRRRPKQTARQSAIAHDVRHERAFLEGVLGSSTDAILFLLPDGTITEWSASARRMYRWGRREALGKRFTMLFPTDVKGSPAELLAAAAAADRARGTTVGVRKDGSRFYGEMTLATVSHSRRDPRGFVLIVRDVTEPVLVQSAAAAVAADLDPSVALDSFFDVLTQVFPIAQLAVCMVDGDHFRCVASAGETVRGLDLHQPVPLAGTAIEKVVATRRPVAVAEVGRERFGSEGPLDAAEIASYVVLPLFQSGPVLGTLGVGFLESGIPTKSVVSLLKSVTTSVTPMLANRLMLEEQARAIRHLRQLDQLKNEFLALIAHDIQTPLSVIGGHGELLQERWDQLTNTEKLENIDAITRNARSLRQIADHALQTARIESGTLPSESVPIDLGACVKRMVDELDGYGSNPRIRVFIEKGLPLASVDPDAHWHILTNLLDNAMKFSPPDAQIDVEVTRRHDAVQVAVRDRGVGISREALPRLFHKFSRITAGEQSTVRGSGLGLFVCRTLVEGHGGRIWVESAPGSGSTFRYTLPVADGTAANGHRPSQRSANKRFR
jgi:PAS domain S-box-containing protein